MKKDINLGYIVFLSIAAAIGGFLFGYDTAVVSGTNEAVWQQFNIGDGSFFRGFYVSAAILGSILGALCGGTVSERIGRKFSMMLAAFLFLISSLWCAVCSNFHELIVARVIGGFGIGLASVVCPCYISELAVAKYRGTLVALYQFAITFGILIAYGVNYLLDLHANTAIESPDLWNLIMNTEVWRGMLGMCAVPALVFIIILFIVPESPRWLVVRGDRYTAEKILMNIYHSKDAVLNEIKSITGEKFDSGFGATDYIKRHRRMIYAILIGVAIAILGQFMGVNAVIYYGPTIFKEVGLEDPLLGQVWIGVVNCATTIIAIFFIDKVGRKGLVYFGVSGMILFLVLAAGFLHFQEEMQLDSVLMIVFLGAYMFCQAISISAIIFVILSEMYPTKIRGLAMSIASMSLWVANWLVSQIFPNLLDALTLKGTFILFAACCIPYMLIMWKLVPETTGKTLEEIEQYWIKEKKSK
ncbi:MAG: sugar porter family MFS transporter [Muribaculaceae bacterium]|nr:sugar porter family MFS transporter [Muribaculaceae bacterium]